MLKKYWWLVVLLFVVFALAGCGAEERESQPVAAAPLALPPVPAGVAGWPDQACSQGVVAVHAPLKYATKIVGGKLVAVPWVFVVCRNASRPEVEAEIDGLFSGFAVAEPKDWYKAGDTIYLIRAQWRWPGQVAICPSAYPLPCLTEWDFSSKPPPKPPLPNFFSWGGSS